MRNAKHHALECFIGTVSPMAILVRVSTVESLHKPTSIRQVVEAFPGEGCRNLNSLRPTLHVINVPARTALGANVETSVRLFPQKAQALGADKFFNIIVTAINYIFEISAIAHIQFALTLKVRGRLEAARRKTVPFDRRVSHVFCQTHNRRTPHNQRPAPFLRRFGFWLSHPRPRHIFLRTSLACPYRHK